MEIHENNVEGATRAERNRNALSQGYTHAIVYQRAEDAAKEQWPCVYVKGAKDADRLEKWYRSIGFRTIKASLSSPVPR